jgi:hypothetical protein
MLLSALAGRSARDQALGELDPSSGLQPTNYAGRLALLLLGKPMSNPIELAAERLMSLEPQTQIALAAGPNEADTVHLGAISLLHIVPELIYLAEAA